MVGHDTVSAEPSDSRETEVSLSNSKQFQNLIVAFRTARVTAFAERKATCNRSLL
jgi:hypothetical protein